MAGAPPRHTKVRLWEFATWCDQIRLPCPAQMPRHDPSPVKPAKAPASQAPAAPSDFLSAEELLALLPFSKPTLYRHMKRGESPQPAKTSDGRVAWLRTSFP